MSPPTPIETLAKSLDGAFPVNYPTFEDEDIIEGMSDFEEQEGIVQSDLYARLDEFGKKLDNELSDLKKLGVGKITKAKERDAKLAERTSEILSNYRAFLYEHGMSDNDSRGSDPPEDGFYELHYHENRMKQMNSSNHGDTKATCLLRDFSTPDVPFGSSEGTERKRKYKIPATPAIIRSKRVKYGLLMSFGLLAIIVAVVTTATKGSWDKMPNKDQTQGGWHEEVEYLLEHDNGDKAKRLPHYTTRVVPKEPTSIEAIPPAQLLEPIQVQDVTSSSEPEVKPKNYMGSPHLISDLPSQSETETKTELKPTELDTSTAIEEVPAVSSPKTSTTNTAIATGSAGTIDMGKILHDKFKPLWLSKKEGWNGGSHDDAIAFCKNIRGKELCPYSAICPYGVGHTVMPGRRRVHFEGEHWAPVYGKDNRWVMVGQRDGDLSDTCKSYEQLEMGASPGWGWNSEQPELKQHIMCCTMS